MVGEKKQGIGPLESQLQGPGIPAVLAQGYAYRHAGRKIHTRHQQAEKSTQDPQSASKGESQTNSKGIPTAYSEEKKKKKRGEKETHSKLCKPQLGSREGEGDGTV